MTCIELIRKLSDYLGGELDPVVAEQIKRDLGQCEDCSLIVSTTRKTIELYCNSEPAPLPKAFRNKLTVLWQTT